MSKTRAWIIVAALVGLIVVSWGRGQDSPAEAAVEKGGAESRSTPIRAVVAVRPEGVDEYAWGNMTNYVPPDPVFVDSGACEATRRIDVSGIVLQPMWVGQDYDETQLRAIDLHGLLRDVAGIEVRVNDWVRVVSEKEAWGMAARSVGGPVYVVFSPSTIWDGELQATNASGVRWPVVVGNETYEKVAYEGRACIGGSAIIVHRDYPCLSGLLAHEFGHVLGLEHGSGGVMDSLQKRGGCGLFYAAKGKLVLDGIWGFCSQCGPWWGVPTSKE